MKKAFTMIELVFVICIMGIIALGFRSVMKSGGTKSEINAITQINTVYADVSSYINKAVTGKGLLTGGNLIFPDYYVIDFTGGNYVFSYYSGDQKIGYSKKALNITGTAGYYLAYAGTLQSVKISKGLKSEINKPSFLINSGNDLKSSIFFSFCNDKAECKQLKGLSIDSRSQNVSLVGKLSTCKTILDSGGSHGDGFYDLGGAEAYCDMTTDGGGWTVIASDGLLKNTQGLIYLGNKPTPKKAGIIMYFIQNPLKDYAKEMKIVNVGNKDNFSNYSITGDWLGTFKLEDSGYGYLNYNNVGFIGGRNGCHKCNFSVIVSPNTAPRTGQYGCGKSFYMIEYETSARFPFNGKEIGGIQGNVDGRFGTIPYSWSFINGSKLWRLGWVTPINPPSAAYEVYYNVRVPSYLMIR